MPAGNYRHRIRVTDDVITGQDSYGQDVIETVDIGKFWCNITPFQGTELVTQEQRFAKALYQIAMRHQPGIEFKPKMTVIWSRPITDRTLNVLDVRDPGEDTRAEITMVAQDFAG